MRDVETSYRHANNRADYYGVSPGGASEMWLEDLSGGSATLLSILPDFPFATASGMSPPPIFRHTDLWAN